LHNNGDGTFTDVSQSSGTHNETRYTFQSTFIDINHDLWPEIFVINDKNTQNTLYLNKGLDGFENVTDQAGFDFFMESMSNSVSDFDHDGDLDIYITNTLGGNALYLNQGDTTFFDIGVTAGVTFNSVCWGALWCDYDNNGWDDLYVLDANPHQSDRNKFYRNNQDNTFEFFIPSGMFEDFSPGYSNTKGDINNDGYPDIALTNHVPTPASLWQNYGGSNAFLKVELQGTVSNRDGIGAWVNVYAGGLEQHKYTVCGDNYLGQNSQRLMFGLASATEVDSIVVEWPSGWVDKWYGTDVNQTLLLVEGATLENSLIVFGALQLCEGDSLFISTSLTGNTVWNDGVAGNARWVLESGNYWATTSVYGFEATTNSFAIVFENAPEPQALVSSVSCFGGSNGEITIENASAYDQIGWSLGEFGAHIQQLNAGTYDAIFRTPLGCETTATFIVEEPTLLNSHMEGTAILCSGDLSTVSIHSTGGVQPYTLSENWFWENLLPAGSYECLVTDANGCSTPSYLNITEPEPLLSSIEVDSETGMVHAMVTGGAPSYTYLWNTGESSAAILPVEWGLISCEISDANNCSAYAEVNYQWLSVTSLEAMPTFIFPNPGNTHFQLVSNGTVQSIIIFDAAGRLVLIGSDVLTNMVNTSHLSAGWYLVRCVDQAGNVQNIPWQKVMN
jgi:hypothetical protein